MPPTVLSDIDTPRETLLTLAIALGLLVIFLYCLLWRNGDANRMKRAAFIFGVGIGAMLVGALWGVEHLTT